MINRRAVILMLLLGFVAPSMAAQQSERPAPSLGESKGNPPPAKTDQNGQTAKPEQKVSQEPVTKSEAQKNEAVSTNAPEQSEKKPSSDWWIVYLTAALVFVGLCQLIAMAVQTYWMRRTVAVAKQSADAATATVKVMEDTAKKQLRPNVYVVGASRHLDEAGIMVIDVKIKNAGLTTAYECSRYMVEAVSRQYPQIPGEFDRIPVSPASIRKSPIPPGETVEFFQTAEPITPQQVSVITGQGSAIYLFGKIVYRDAFGDEHFTNFRLECMGENFLRGRFAPSESGNEAT
ncbi:MAG: hypothetical protein WA798_18025 [Candidatus Acidiferrum sp.]